MITFTDLLLGMSIPAAVSFIGIVLNLIAFRSIRTEHRRAMEEIRHAK